MRELGMPENRDIVKEAQLIIDRYASRIPAQKRIAKRKRIREKRLWFFAGILTSTAFFLAVFLKF